MAMSISTNMKSFRRQNQQGVAAVLLLIMIPILLALMTLTQESARYLQERTWLGNTTEATALLLSSSQAMSDADSTRLAQDMLEAVTTSGRTPDVSVSFRTCRENPTCDQGDSAPYMEYKVHTHNRHNQLFSADYPVSTRDWQLQHHASVRKNEDYRTIDVAFVADYSHSMYFTWPGRGKIDVLRDLMTEKIETLHSVVGVLADEIEALSADVTERRKNTMSYIPFIDRTQEKMPGTDGEFCKKNQVVNDNAEQAVKDLFVDKYCEPHTLMLNFNKIFTIKPVTKAKIIKDSFKLQKAMGATATYEGIIRAAQILNETNNQRRIIMIMSDCGDVDSTEPVHTQLNDLGYCDKIRQQIGSQKTPDGKDVSLEIAVIGFGCLPEQNVKRCADKDRVYSADTPDQFYRLLKKAIGEDFGRLHQDAP